MENTTRRMPWGIIGLTLTGVAVGAAVGVLYAPKKGEETRKDLKNWLAKKREQSRNLLVKSKETSVQKRDMIADAIKNRRFNGVKDKELIAA